MRVTLCLFAALLFAPFSFGQDLTLPETIKGEAGDFILIKAETKGEIVRWVALEGIGADGKPVVGLNLFPADTLRDPKVTVVVGKRPGKWKLLAYTAILSEDKVAIPSMVATCVVEIAGAIPPPIIPPTPPDPPEPPLPKPPSPVPPSPVDTFTKKIKAAWAGDTTPGDKAYKVQYLASIFREASANLPSSSSVAELFAKLGAAADVKLALTDLRDIRLAIMDELIATFGDNGAIPVDAALARSTFARVATSLEGLSSGKAKRL